MNSNPFRDDMQHMTPRRKNSMKGFHKVYAIPDKSIIQRYTTYV